VQLEYLIHFSTLQVSRTYLGVHAVLDSEQLPIWFQAIQGIKAFDSGTLILPTALGTVLFSFVAGFGVAKTGYYTPFMIVGAALPLTGASLSTTFHISSPATQWVIYQLIFSAGAGLGIQQAHTAAQTVLAAADFPTGAVILIFAQIMGGNIWLSVAQNILTSQLLHGLKDSVPSLNLQMILDMCHWIERSSWGTKLGWCTCSVQSWYS
jgi:hypothetical protein